MTSPWIHHFVIPILALVLIYLEQLPVCLVPLVKEQYVANKGGTPGPTPPIMYATPPHPGNHEMNASQMVHGGEYVPLDKGPVPPFASNPTTQGR
nr:hypothetical protein CFP56_28402 [Quercus suber]